MSVSTNGKSEDTVRAAHRFSERAVAELAEIVTHYPEKRAAMLPALWIAQREYGGHLTPEAILEVADRLDRPPAEVEGVATFYTMYNLRPRGKHHLEVCTCLTCACLGAYEVVHALEKKLGVHLGETTPDGEFTLSEAECLNACAEPVVIQVGDRYFTGITVEGVDRFLEDLRGSQEHTPAALADAVVRAMLPAGGAG